MTDARESTLHVVTAANAEALPSVAGVHIADVSYFVPFDSALDKDARARATSTYLVQKV